MIAPLLCILTALALASGASALPTPPHLHLNYDNALGAWLPKTPEWFDPWRRHEAVQSQLADWVIYPGVPPNDVQSNLGPPDGTRFAYGKAGPPRVLVVYDPAHRIAWFSEGCCAGSHIVVAGEIKPPPHPVVRRDLSTLRTHLGIRLGDTPAQVRSVFGPAPLKVVKADPSQSALYYFYMYPNTLTCGRFKNFYFRGGRLILIEYVHGC